MSTEAGPRDDRQTPRRVALVLADHSAAAGSPPGIDPAAFAAACLVDSYEVLADLVEVRAGIVGAGSLVTELLWPGDLRIDPRGTVADLVNRLSDSFDEVVLVPADVPDLPGLVIAKVFKALQRADVCIARERNEGGGCVALGVRTPLADWVGDRIELDLDTDLCQVLAAAAPHRSRFAVGPDWHRMRTSAAIQRLDPGLEGWDATRLLLSGG